MLKDAMRIFEVDGLAGTAVFSPTSEIGLPESPGWEPLFVPRFLRWFLSLWFARFGLAPPVNSRFFSV